MVYPTKFGYDLAPLQCQQRGEIITMKTISVAVFSPTPDFNQLDLAKKVTALVEQIQKAYRMAKTANAATTVVFLCPEFTFVNPADKTYAAYTKEQMQEVQAELQLLCHAIGNDLIILPGTARTTHTKQDANLKNITKSTLFGSHNIKINKRGKGQLDLTNGDGIEKIFENNGLFNRNGIRFGIEIADDHQLGMLKRMAGIYETTVDVHIVLASGTALQRDKLVNQTNVIAIIANSLTEDNNTLTTQPKIIRFDASGRAHEINPIDINSTLKIFPNIAIPHAAHEPRSLRAKL